jgi:(S)-ureidoglycine aminohydrolase
LWRSAPGGGAPKAEFEAGVEGVIFVTRGKVNLTLDGELHQLEEGGYAYLAAGSEWGLENVSERRCLLPLDPQGLRAS